MAQRVAVVTGASRGIGQALAERLTSQGQTVIALARSRAGLDALSAQTGAIGYVLDVADPAAVAEIVARIISDHGVPDLLVNNAALSGGSALTCDLPEADWWRVMEVNVRGTQLCTRAVLPGMITRGSGRIVNLSSGAATFPIGLDNDGELTSAYMASKAAVNRFTEAVAGECHASGVRVFALSPGMVKTDMTAEVFTDIWDDDDVWTPIERSLDLICDMDSGLLDALSGRYLRAAIDDWRAVAARADEVLELDTHALRLRELP
jgi:3-oxoacyl-[acyl-carrier protein] reductase